MIKLHYPHPRAIRIYRRFPGLPLDSNGKVQRVEVPPLPEIPAASGRVKRVLEKDGNGDLILPECGRNIYFHNNYTTEFAIRESYDCQVEVKLVNVIRLTARFEMPFEDFFTAGG